MIMERESLAFISCKVDFHHQMTVIGFFSSEIAMNVQFYPYDNLSFLDLSHPCFFYFSTTYNDTGTLKALLIDLYDQHSS